jgi:AbrB family looped-hinge helix DNA binding protein
LNDKLYLFDKLYAIKWIDLGERIMFGKVKFFGSATVSERGQVVLPIELRKKMKLQAGDKLIVMGTLGDNVVLLLKTDFLTQILGKMEQGQNELRKLLKNNPNSQAKKDKKAKIN